MQSLLKGNISIAFLQSYILYWVKIINVNVLHDLHLLTYYVDLFTNRLMLPIWLGVSQLLCTKLSSDFVYRFISLCIFSNLIVSLLMLIQKLCSISGLLSHCLHIVFSWENCYVPKCVRLYGNHVQLERRLETHRWNSCTILLVFFFQQSPDQIDNLWRMVW